MITNKSDIQVLEVHGEYFLLLHINFSRCIVGREYQINFPAERAEADDPVEGVIHVLLDALGVTLEGLMHLVNSKDQLHGEDLLAH